MTTFIFYFNHHHEKFQLSHCFVAVNVIDIFIGLVTNLLPNDLAYPKSQLSLIRCLGLSKMHVQNKSVEQHVLETDAGKQLS
jgi:hypothetical protein